MNTYLQKLLYLLICSQSQVSGSPKEVLSHDNGVTMVSDPCPYTSPSPLSGSPPPYTQQQEGVLYLSDEPDLLTRSPYKLRPPLSVSDVSDLFAGTVTNCIPLNFRGMNGL